VDDKIDQHDVARYLGVSTRTVRTLIKRGELPPPIRIGRKQFWLKDKFMRCWTMAEPHRSGRARLGTRRTPSFASASRGCRRDSSERRLVKWPCRSRTGPSGHIPSRIAPRSTSPNF